MHASSHTTRISRYFCLCGKCGECGECGGICIVLYCTVLCVLMHILYPSHRHSAQDSSIITMITIITRYKIQDISNFKAIGSDGFIPLRFQISDFIRANPINRHVAHTSLQIGFRFSIFNAQDRETYLQKQVPVCWIPNHFVGKS